MTAYVVGIDPGATGAIAWATPEGFLVAMQDLPNEKVKIGATKKTRLNIHALRDMLEMRRPAAIYIEHQQPHQKDGKVSIATMMLNYGNMLGLFAGLNIGFREVAPKAWKGAMQLPADKTYVRLKASQEWPGLADQFVRQDDDGRAEACFLASYGARMMRGDWPGHPAVRDAA